MPSAHVNRNRNILRSVHGVTLTCSPAWSLLKCGQQQTFTACLFSSFIFIFLFFIIQTKINKNKCVFRGCLVTGRALCLKHSDDLTLDVQVSLSRVDSERKKLCRTSRVRVLKQFHLLRFCTFKVCHLMLGLSVTPFVFLQVSQEFVFPWATLR